MNHGRPLQPATTFSLPNFIIITITTIITITDMGMDMDPGMDMDRVSWSCRDTGVITIITTTITASIPAIEVVSYGMTIKQDLRVLFFYVAPGCLADAFSS